MEVIRSERVNESEDLICEYCGKPIVRKYDCIGHHRKPLTEENVNDAYISLNPENVMVVHHRCHNKIHNKLGYANKRVYLVWGSPLSGKSTWVRDAASTGDLIVDMDSIWECVSGCERYEKPRRLNSVVFGVRDCLLEMVRYRRGKWLNAYVIGGYPLSGERERLLDTLAAESIFIDTTKEECISRLHECGDNRNVDEWEKYILDWWDKFTPPLS